MRLLFLVHQFLPEFAGGTERVTLNLAQAAQADGHQVEIATVTLTPGAPAHGFMVEGLPVTAFTRQRINGPADLGFEPDAPFAAQFRAFLAQQAPFDAVHVMHSFRLLDAVEILAEQKIPYAVTLTDFFTICHKINLVRSDGALCGGPEGGETCERICGYMEFPQGSCPPRYKRLEQALRNASAVVAVSDYVAGEMRKTHPWLKMAVVNNGVDLLAFGPPAPRPADRPLTFGYLGTVSEMKGAAVLARAFARAAPENARLRIVGPDYDPALLAALKQDTAGASVTWEGAIPAGDVPAMLGEFDILCVPSQVPEAYSLALYEGFAAGLPALVSDLGNLGLAVRGAGCGRAVPSTDEQAWATAIGEIAADPQVLDAWRRRLPLPFRIEEEAALYAQIYRGLAGLRRPAVEAAA